VRLCIREAYLSDVQQKYRYMSVINIFSDILDLRNFLKDVKKVLKSDAEIFIDSGD